MKFQKPLAFFDATTTDWNTIEQFFEIKEELQDALLAKIDDQKRNSNFSFFELLKVSFDLSKIPKNDKLETEEKEEQIQIEKNYRHQAYTALDFILSRNSYFDYFSFDSFTILKNAKFLIDHYKKEFVTNEFLLFSCISSDSSLTNLLKEFGFDNDFLEKYLLKTPKLNKNSSFFEKFVTNFDDQKQKLEKKLTDFSFDNNTLIISEEKRKKESLKTVPFSKEVYVVFEKAAESAIRYKSPIITEEILFLTLLEEEKSSATLFFKKVLKNEIQKTLLRYKLLKLIHSQEAIIRTTVPKNQHFFTYLLKTQLSTKDFTKLIETKKLEEAVNVFRNNIISSALLVNVSELLTLEMFDRRKNQNVKELRRYSI